MRRKIKFRGKDCLNHWVYGCYFHRLGYLSTIITHFLTDDGKVGYREVFVIKESVGQFTGLTDKNGTEIYEGDIVKDKRGNSGYIEFSQQEMGYMIVWAKHNSRLGHRAAGSSYDRDYSLEVIGNIHDNQELLQKKL